MFIWFAASAFRKLPSIYVFSYVPFGFEGRMWDLIISVPGHCLSIYFDLVTILYEIYWESPKARFIGCIYKSTNLDERI